MRPQQHPNLLCPKGWGAHARGPRFKRRASLEDTWAEEEAQGAGGGRDCRGPGWRVSFSSDSRVREGVRKDPFSLSEIAFPGIQATNESSPRGARVPRQDGGDLVGCCLPALTIFADFMLPCAVVVGLRGFLKERNESWGGGGKGYRWLEGEKQWLLAAARTVRVGTHQYT